MGEGSGILAIFIEVLANEMKRILLALCFLCTFIVCAQEKTLPALWKHITFERGGCTLGMQYYKDGMNIPRGRTGVFQSENWNIFVTMDKKPLTEFLLSKLESNTETKVHTCPFF